MPVECAPDEIWVPYCPLAGLDDACRSACLALLEPSECRRYERYLSASAADQFLVGRAALRACLSRMTAVAPADWRFETNAHGKPRLASTHGIDGISFNVSHTRGMIACAICRQWDVGVDVEALTRTHEAELAERFFTPAEAAAIRRAEGAAQQEAFFQVWTLKEAVIKARGIGLSCPLSAFEVQPAANPPRVLFSETMPDDPKLWQLFSFRLESAFQAAVAVRRPVGLTVRFFAQPLRLDSTGVIVP